MTEVERTEQVRAAAQETLTVRKERLDVLRKQREGQARKLEDARARLCAADPEDDKEIARLGRERRLHADTIENLDLKVKEAEVDVGEAERALAAAEREHLQAQQVERFLALLADRTRYERELTARTTAYFELPEEQRDARTAVFLAEIRPLLGQYHEVWGAGWKFVCACRPSTRAAAEAERMQVWPGSPWPGGRESDADLLDGLERVVLPEVAERKRTARAQATARAREDATIRTLLGVVPPPPAPARVADSGLTEEDLAAMRGPMPELGRGRTADQGGGRTGRDLPRLAAEEAEATQQGTRGPDPARNGR